MQRRRRFVVDPFRVTSVPIAQSSYRRELVVCRYPCLCKRHRRIGLLSRPRTTQRLRGGDRAAVTQPLIVRGDGEPLEIHLRASAGLAEGGGVMLDDLIRAADASLYRAKRAGGNRVGDPSSGSSRAA